MDYKTAFAPSNKGYEGGFQHHRVLALAEVVVRTPDHHVAGLARRRGPGGDGKGAAMALQIGEDPIAALVAHLAHGGLERGLVVHQPSSPRSAGERGGSSHEPASSVI